MICVADPRGSAVSALQTHRSLWPETRERPAGLCGPFPSGGLLRSFSCVSELSQQHVNIHSCVCVERWSCATSASPASSERSLSVARSWARRPTWRPRWSAAAATTALWTCGRWASSCTSAWAARSPSTRTRTSGSRSPTPPSCTHDSPGPPSHWRVISFYVLNSSPVGAFKDTLISDFVIFVYLSSWFDFLTTRLMNARLFGNRYVLI